MAYQQVLSKLLGNEVLAGIEQEYYPHALKTKDTPTNFVWNTLSMDSITKSLLIDCRRKYYTTRFVHVIIMSILE